MPTFAIHYNAVKQTFYIPVCYNSFWQWDVGTQMSKKSQPTRGNLSGDLCMGHLSGGGVCPDTGLVIGLGLACHQLSRNDTVELDFVVKDSPYLELLFNHYMYLQIKVKGCWEKLHKNE